MRRITTLLMLVSLLLPLASAAGKIVLRTTVKPTEAWVGQRVVLQVDVLGEDSWAQISQFGDVDLPGAYLIRTDSQGTRLQESIEGVSYTGQRYEVSLYPQKVGAIEVPPLPVEVKIKSWGADSSHSTQQKQTPAVTFDVKLPPGAEGVRGLVSTARFSAKQQWAPPIDTPKVGDALQRTVTLQAEDVSGMAFVPLEYADLPGVGIYPAEPEVADSADRGTLTGRRSEAATYVFERAGMVQIPEIRLIWWNVDKEKLETITLPGRELEIAPGLAGSSEVMGGFISTRVGARDLWLPGAILMILAALLMRFGRPLVQGVKAWRRRRRDSEAQHFNRVLRSARSKNARLALRDIMRWLDRIDKGPAPAQLQTFVRRYGDGEEQLVVDQLLDGVATSGRLADPEQLIKVLVAMRMRWREAGRSKLDAAFVLPGLNHR